MSCINEDTRLRHWVCSKCSKNRTEERGRRFREVGEKCPLCNDPGVGMVLIPVESST